MSALLAVSVPLVRGHALLATPALTPIQPVYRDALLVWLVLTLHQQERLTAKTVYLVSSTLLVTTLAAQSAKLGHTARVVLPCAVTVLLVTTVATELLVALHVQQAPTALSHLQRVLLVV
jgi:hypothetical protein